MKETANTCILGPNSTLVSDCFKASGISMDSTIMTRLVLGSVWRWVENSKGKSRFFDGTITLGLTSLENPRRVYLEPTCRTILSSVPYIELLLII